MWPREEHQPFQWLQAVILGQPTLSNTLYWESEFGNWLIFSMLPLMTSILLQSILSQLMF